MPRNLSGVLGQVSNVHGLPRSFHSAHGKLSSPLPLSSAFAHRDPSMSFDSKSLERCMLLQSAEGGTCEISNSKSLSQRGEQQRSSQGIQGEAGLGGGERCDAAAVLRAGAGAHGSGRGDAGVAGGDCARQGVCGKCTGPQGARVSDAAHPHRAGREALSDRRDGGKTHAATSFLDSPLFLIHTNSSFILPSFKVHDQD